MKKARGTILCAPYYKKEEKTEKERGKTMDNRSMMELEDELDAKFNDLVNYCMVSGAIDQNLYTAYGRKKRAAVMPAVKGY